jgi:D-alanyl-D-alanine dipeptidase
MAQDSDFVDIQSINPRILVDCDKCFLRRKVAMKLDLVQKQLEKIGLGLKLWDGYRPKGSRHNRGAAVDLTLVDKEGKELRMPTDFDDFSIKAHRNFERLPKDVICNRQLLENIMCQHGFIPLATKWWHFDDSEGEKYPIEDRELR